MKFTPKDYRAGNLDAARIILETPGMYGAGMVEWARRVRGEWPEVAVAKVPLDPGAVIGVSCL